MPTTALPVVRFFVRNTKLAQLLPRQGTVFAPDTTLHCGLIDKSHSRQQKSLLNTKSQVNTIL